MNIYLKRLSWFCVLIFIAQVALFFLLPVPNIVFGDGDPLGLIGVLFLSIILWVIGAIIISIYSSIQNKYLATLAVMGSILALYVFVQLWFFGGLTSILEKIS